MKRILFLFQNNKYLLSGQNYLKNQLYFQQKHNNKIKILK